MKHPLRFIQLAIPYACLVAIACFIGCGIGDWSSKLTRGYGFVEPGGGVCITKEGGLDGGVQAIDEAVEYYWTDGDHLAVKLQNTLYPSGADARKIPAPYVLIEMRTDKWQRFNTEQSLTTALPPKATSSGASLRRPTDVLAAAQ